MAIFALFAHEPSWRFYVRKSQLIATEAHDYSTTFGDQNVFCIGYAEPCDSTFATYVNNYQLLCQNDPQIQQIFQHEVPKNLRSKCKHIDLIIAYHLRRHVPSSRTYSSHGELINHPAIKTSATMGAQSAWMVRYVWRNDGNTDTKPNTKSDRACQNFWNV